MNWKNLIMLLVLSSLTMVSCKKDDDGGTSANALAIVSIEAKGTSFQDGAEVISDLNGAASAIDVATNATITITFDKDVDATSVNAASAGLTYIRESLTLSVIALATASGNTITISPTEDLVKGTLHTLTLTGITATDGGILAETNRSFTTEGRAPVIVPNADDMIAYWSFDGNADDATGNFNADNMVAIEFGMDRFDQNGSTATFDGDESLIEVPGADALMASDDFTLSFWVKTNTLDHVNENGDPSGHFVMGLGAFFGFQFELPGDISFCKLAVRYATADGGSQSEDTFFNGDGMDNTNGGWQGHPFRADLSGSGGVEGILKDKWAHVLFTHDAATKVGTMYLNGVVMQIQDFNLWPDTDPKQTVTGVEYGGSDIDVEPILAFGFIKSADSPMWAETPWGDYYKPTSNHFKGDLDDVRIFKAPFSADDAKDLYDAEKN